MIYNRGNMILQNQYLCLKAILKKKKKVSRGQFFSYKTLVLFFIDLLSLRVKIAGLWSQTVSIISNVKKINVFQNRILLTHTHHSSAYCNCSLLGKWHICNSHHSHLNHFTEYHSNARPQVGHRDGHLSSAARRLWGNPRSESLKP